MYVCIHQDPVVRSAIHRCNYSAVESALPQSANACVVNVCACVCTSRQKYWTFARIESALPQSEDGKFAKSVSVHI